MAFLAWTGARSARAPRTPGAVLQRPEVELDRHAGGPAEGKQIAHTLVTGIWNSLGRLALPAVGLGLLAVSGHISDPRLTAAAAGASGVLLAGLLVAVAALRVGAVADLLARVLPRAWRPRRAEPVSCCSDCGTPRSIS